MENNKLIKTEIPVLKMTCAACAVSVESIIKAQPGVVTAAVNYASSSVNVEFLADKISPKEIRNAVQSIGYDLYIDDPLEYADSLEVIRFKNYAALKKNTFSAIILSLPIVIIGMFYMQHPYANPVMWILSTPVVLWFGRGFFINAWKQARNRRANMDTLVALSTGVAYLFSTFNTVLPEFWLNKGMQPHVYFEAAAVIIAFILLGKLLEEKAKSKTSSALRKLMGLQPKTVTLLKPDGNQELVPIDIIQNEDLIVVKPGEKIAVDGQVISGTSFVDESLLTGEPMPIQKKENDLVFAGTINQNGSITFKAQKVGSETILAQIIKTVQEAQNSKAPVQKLADRLAGIFVPVVILLAIISFFTWLIFGGDNGFVQGLLALITVLVIACPCALGLATPTAIMVGIGKAAENGILIKDAESLEQAKKINAVVLDKTGTITEGKPSVTNMQWTKYNSKYRNILVSLENHSEHPLAKAIIAHFPEAKTIPMLGFESIPGLGIKAIYENDTYFAGNRAFMEDNGITLNATLLELVNKWSLQGNSLVYFATEKGILAVIAISDKIKESSLMAIQHLGKMDIEVFMLTGDNYATANTIASQTGIKNIKAEVLPHQKADFIKELQNKGKIVAMVGDGINDSSALAQADVSIAMGKGSDIAMDVAKMTIISSDLMKIPIAIKLSKQTVNTIKENLFWAFIYNIIGIPIAAGILYPFTGFLLNPILAGAAMALSSVSVVSNSLRLKWKKDFENQTKVKPVSTVSFNKQINSTDNKQITHSNFNMTESKKLTKPVFTKELVFKPTLAYNNTNVDEVKTYQFKTNINCDGCIASISPHLNKIEGITHWQVDTNNSNKVLTVKTNLVSKEEIIKTVTAAGYKIEYFL